MVLELLVIAGAIYFITKKNKQDKLKRAAYQAGEPYYHNNGAVTYPPGYPNLPPYTPARTEQPRNEYQRQIPVQTAEYYQREQSYSDAVPVNKSIGDEKTPLMVETREVMNEKH